MPERLRALLEQPLAPGAATAVVCLAAAAFVGFAAVASLGVLESTHHGGREPHRSRSLAPASLERPHRGGTGERRIQQDPQDRAGSRAAFRASRSLRTHRALQQVPFRIDGLSVEFVGAHHGRAVLLVTAPTIVAARRSWHSFLHDYNDAGEAYEPHFRAERRRSGKAGRDG